MSTTAEVRWFFEGQVPDEIEQWFCRSNLALKAAPREDHYLLFPAVLGLGLKMREGRLEVKSLIKTLGVRSFTADVAGKDRKSTRLNSSHGYISYAVFCLKKKNQQTTQELSGIGDHC